MASHTSSELAAAAVALRAAADDAGVQIAAGSSVPVARAA